MSLGILNSCSQGGTWVGKPGYLAADLLTIQEGWQEITRAITECQIKVRCPVCPCLNPVTPKPFRFDHLRDSPQKDTPGDANSDHQLLPCQPLRGWNHNQCTRDQGLPPPQLPSPSPDHRFKSDKEFSVDSLIDVVTVRQV